MASVSVVLVFHVTGVQRAEEEEDWYWANILTLNNYLFSLLQHMMRHKQGESFGGSRCVKYLYDKNCTIYL